LSSAHESISAWLSGLKKGESACAQRLYGDVYEQLVGIARRRMNGKTPRWADEEDVALSAFHSFCRAAAAGKFPRLENRDDLWKLLVRITTRKAKDYLRAANRKKRGGGRVRGDSAFGDADDSQARGGLDQAAAADGQTPEMVMLLAEECRHLLDSLGDDTLRQIAVWKVEGHTDVEIAAKLGCVVRTVERKMQRIREKWSKLDR